MIKTIVHKLRMAFDEEYKKKYQRKLKFARIMTANKSIMEGIVKSA